MILLVHLPDPLCWCDLKHDFLSLPDPQRREEMHIVHLTCKESKDSALLKIYGVSF